jgi:ribosomal protein L37E
VKIETFLTWILFYAVIVIVATPELFNLSFIVLIVFGLIYVGRELALRLPAVQQWQREKEAVRDRASRIALRKQALKQQQEDQAREKFQQEKTLLVQRQKVTASAQIIKVLKNVSERIRLEEKHRGAGGLRTILLEARGALEGGLFFGREDFSVKERIHIRKSGKPQFGLLPPSGHEAWLTETRLWTAYAQRDLQFLSDSLQKTHSKCSRCGRSVSVRNKFEAMSQLAKELKLPDSLYWRQAVLNAQWRTLKWQLDPADLLPPQNALVAPRLPLSAAALNFIHLKGEDNDRLGDENSPFPYFHIAKSHSDQRFRDFLDDEKRHSDNAWEVAKILASISDRVDDCLECVGLSIKSRRSRSKLSPRQREAVMMRDAFRCQNCGRNAREDQVKLHIDHIVPWSKGGTDDMENLRTLCDECNLGKSDQIVV